MGLKTLLVRVWNLLRLLFTARRADSFFWVYQTGKNENDFYNFVHGLIHEMAGTYSHDLLAFLIE